jgi:hypothetical protein
MWDSEAILLFSVVKIPLKDATLEKNLIFSLRKSVKQHPKHSSH